MAKIAGEPDAVLEAPTLLATGLLVGAPPGLLDGLGSFALTLRLERLAALDRVSAELRELVEEQHPVVPQRS